jgi:hypothetical protein
MRLGLLLEDATGYFVFGRHVTPAVVLADVRWLQPSIFRKVFADDGCRWLSFEQKTFDLRSIPRPASAASGRHRNATAPAMGFVNYMLGIRVFYQSTYLDLV